MSIPHQNEIPISFKVMYGGNGLHSRYAPRDFVANRHQLCAEMTAVLIEMAQHMYSNLGMNKEAVLHHCRRGLNKRGSVVTDNESLWVISRLEESLDWQATNAH